MIVHDIGHDLAEYYGAALFYGGNLKPEQPNNELRNALNHMARALEAADVASAQEDLGKAAGHIERAKRDSLKLATIGLFDEIRGILGNAALYNGGVPPALSVRRSELNGSRRDIYAAESAGYRGTTLQMLKLYAESDAFLKELQELYPAVNSKRRWRMRLYHIRNHFLSYAIAFGLGVAGSLTASYLWENYYPSPAPEASH